MEFVLQWLGSNGFLVALLLLLPIAIASELFNFLPLRAKRPDDKDKS